MLPNFGGVGKRLPGCEGGEEGGGMNERAKTIGLIADMLCKIADEKLLNRIYRFTKYKLALKGEMTHETDLSTDPRGSLIRIDHALEKMPDRLAAIQAQLDNLFAQQEAAKGEVGKPFPQEDELREKSARLAELDALLNIDGGHRQEEQAIAKCARPSVLDSLKRPAQPGPDRKMPKAVGQEL